VLKNGSGTVSVVSVMTVYRGVELETAEISDSWNAFLTNSVTQAVFDSH
jgi:hypothetical protein